MVKRITSLLVAVLLLISVCPAYAEDEIKVFVNGDSLQTDVAPIIVEGRTLVPLRVIFEALGAWVDWNGDTQTVTARKDDITISLQIGSNTLIKNGSYITLDVPAQLVNSRTLVPVRAVAESFGAEVEWDGESNAVYIYLFSDDDWYDIDWDDDGYNDGLDTKY